ncbi:MAG: hypothetical protein VCE75_20900 [Alphaproteobacteria bacterium]
MPLDRTTFRRFTVARLCHAGFDEPTNRHAARYVLHNIGNRAGRRGSPNVAARVQGESTGGDIVNSDDLMAATGVRGAFRLAGAAEPAEEKAELRGAAKAVPLWRQQLDPSP